MFSLNITNVGSVSNKLLNQLRGFAQFIINVTTGLQHLKIMRLQSCKIKIFPYSH